MTEITLYLVKTSTKVSYVSVNLKTQKSFCRRNFYQLTNYINQYKSALDRRSVYTSKVSVLYIQFRKKTLDSTRTLNKPRRGVTKTNFRANEKREEKKIIEKSFVTQSFTK